MSRLISIDQKNVLLLFKDSNFLIPEYQRQYAWSVNECQTLWDDVCSFAFPDGIKENFVDDEYYLGPIVMFKQTIKVNDMKKSVFEVIDGQQRITTILLLLRAFYANLEPALESDAAIKKVMDDMASCIWVATDLGLPNTEQAKITSLVISDTYRLELEDILKKGTVEKGFKSNYSRNYLYFQKVIEQFKDKHPTDFIYLPRRIMDYCIILPIEADSRDTALRIFSTLNDRGMPLSDSDIFKAELYKFFELNGDTRFFNEEWGSVSEFCEDSSNETTMDELFTQYMYFKRAEKGIVDTSKKSLRSFYEKFAGDHYALLHNEKTFYDLRILANFWQAVYDSDDIRLTKEMRIRLFVIRNTPSGIWKYFVSVYFLNSIKKMSTDENLKEVPENWNLDEKFIQFLDRAIGFIVAQSILNASADSLKAPLYYEMVNIVNGIDITFSNYRFKRDAIKERFDPRNEVFSGTTQIVRSILSWWLFYYTKEGYSDISVMAAGKLHIEHIYAKKRAELEDSLEYKDNLESIGNKALLEQSVNIRASDYTFDAKKIIYKNGRATKKAKGCPTKNRELLDLVDYYKDFKDTEIEDRRLKIMNSFIKFLDDIGLLDE